MMISIISTKTYNNSKNNYDNSKLYNGVLKNRFCGQIFIQIHSRSAASLLRASGPRAWCCERRAHIREKSAAPSDSHVLKHRCLVTPLCASERPMKSHNEGEKWHISRWKQNEGQIGAPRARRRSDPAEREAWLCSWRRPESRIWNDQRRLYINNKLTNYLIN